MATPLKGGIENRKALARLMARHGKSIAKQSEGRAGKNICQWVGRVITLRAVRDRSRPSFEERYEQALMDHYMKACWTGVLRALLLERVVAEPRR